MPWLPGALLLVPAALLQVTLAPHLEVFGVFPNLVLVLVAGWTLTRGAASGIRWGIAGGLALDLLSPGPLGVHALALAGAAYATGFVQRNYDPDPVVLPALAGVVAGLAYNLVLVAVAESLGNRLLVGAVVVHWVLPATAFNAALMPPVVFCLRRLEARLPRRVVEVPG